ncbi:cation:proton antiporter [Geminocystis sp. GBBB08]|uniref:cation:proton antiporter n=1 Tax=Geminocystis sp. GBBB08 TaxID=2604140 RepID=UPI0027E2B104|nr:cation:proton antiporter [Geminocystis sp. GBBB08]MBL1210169.1 cation:proton antiporter [Geminocystis sp. GBBB08]
MTNYYLFCQLPNPITDPVAVFLIMMGVLLIAPILFEKIKLPGIVGLIVAGIIVGPHGLGLLARDKTIILFGTVGLLFLMFMAGLETSLDDLKENGDKATIFGLSTFAVPMILGMGAMLFIGYDLLAAILVASCFASHTLLSLPIVSKRGLMRTPMMTITLGGTLIVNILALLVLTIVVRASEGGLSLGFWLFLIPSLAIYTFATLFGVPKLGRWFFRTFGRDEGAEFTFVVLTLFVVSYAAKLIDIEPIIGAFLAGISIRPLIPQLSPLMNRIQFIGNTLFIPLFLLSVGMLVNPKTLISEPRSFVVSGAMIVVSIVAKFIPAWGVGKYFNFSFSNTMVMFGLSVAQAASTLAAITVAFQINLVDELTVNGTIAMILVTCIVSPWVTTKWADQIKAEESSPSETLDIKDNGEEVEQKPPVYRVVVPVANPNTEDNLLNLALLLVNATKGKLFPLHILTDVNGIIPKGEKIRQAQLLETAEMIAHATSTDVKSVARIESSIDQGILHVYQECDANIIICGWKGFSSYKDNFFGSIIDNVIQKAPIPVLIARFTEPIKTTQRVVLAISDFQYNSSSFVEALILSKILANELQANLHILLVSSRASSIVVDNRLTGLSFQQLKGNFTRRVLQEMQPDDLLLLMAIENYKVVGTSTLGSIPEAIARNYRQVSMMIICLKSSKSNEE